MNRTQIIQNAKSAAKRDGYDQMIFVDRDGDYTFIRSRSNIEKDISWDITRVIGYIRINWDRGIPKIKYMEA